MGGSSKGSPPPALPAWLSNPSVTLSLGAGAAASFPQGTGTGTGAGTVVTELVEWCREVEEGHRAWAAHKKEAAWRLSRAEAQIESEKARRRREKMEEVEAKVKALREDHQAALDRIEAEYRDQLSVLRRDADAKDQKLADHWAARHARLSALLDHLATTTTHS